MKQIGAVGWGTPSTPVEKDNIYDNTGKSKIYTKTKNILKLLQQKIYNLTFLELIIALDNTLQTSQRPIETAVD